MNMTIIHDGINQLQKQLSLVDNMQLVIHSSIDQLQKQLSLVDNMQLVIHSSINQLKLIIHYRMIKWKVRSVKGPPNLEVASM